jgi:hypothetical protein
LAHDGFHRIPPFKCQIRSSSCDLSPYETSVLSPTLRLKTLVSSYKHLEIKEQTDFILQNSRIVNVFLTNERNNRITCTFRKVVL